MRAASGPSSRSLTHQVARPLVPEARRWSGGWGLHAYRKEGVWGSYKTQEL